MGLVLERHELSGRAMHSYQSNRLLMGCRTKFRGYRLNRDGRSYLEICVFRSWFSLEIRRYFLFGCEDTADSYRTVSLNHSRVSIATIDTRLPDMRHSFHSRHFCVIKRLIGLDQSRLGSTKIMLDNPTLPIHTSFPILMRHCLTK